MLEFIMAFSLSSPVFNHTGPIPKLYTCQGKDISPRLNWSGLPNGTKSVALIVDDPDAPDPAAPTRVWVHWVLYNIPASATGLPEARELDGPAARHAPGSQRLGSYRLRRAVPADRSPPLLPQALRARRRAAGPQAADEGDLLEAMEGHVLEEAELIGTYQKT